MSAPTIPSAERRALNIAIAALQEISDETTTMGPEHTAEAALDLIRLLLPKAATGERSR